MPDRIFLPGCGEIFFIEFKAPGKKATKKQAREIQRLKDQGYHAYVIDNVMEGRAVIDEWVERASVMRRLGCM